MTPGSTRRARRSPSSPGRTPSCATCPSTTPKACTRHSRWRRRRSRRWPTRPQTCHSFLRHRARPTCASQTRPLPGIGRLSHGSELTGLNLAFIVRDGPARLRAGTGNRTGRGRSGPQLDGPRRSTGDDHVWGRRDRTRGAARPVICFRGTSRPRRSQGQVEGCELADRTLKERSRRVEALQRPLRRTSWSRGSSCG